MHRTLPFRLLLIAAALTAAGLALAAPYGSPLRTTARSAPVDGAQARQLYIVQMSEPPAVAMYAAMTNRVQAASLTRGTRPQRYPRERFNPNAREVRQHVQRLQTRHMQTLLAANALQDQVYSYSYAFNGFAVLLTPQEAERMRLRKGVIGVWQDRARPLQTAATPGFLGLLDADGGLRTDLGLQGEDIIIGVIDSGIATDHPSLSEREQARDIPRICRSEWADSNIIGRWLCRRWTRPGDVVFGPPPETWAGTCETGEGFEITDCNNKLIGARFYRAGFDQLDVALDPNEFNSPLDADGHGTHIASIAGGNPVDARIFGRNVGRISGMAPRARIAVYKACWLVAGTTRASCSTADLQKAIEDAVADGVDIINYSLGTLDFSVSDPDDIALLAAAEAGVFSAVAAGNSGPEPETIESPGAAPWVMTVGASTRPGRRVSEGERINKPESIAGDIESREAAFTPRLSERGPITGLLVLADDSQTTTADGANTGTVFDACSPLTNGDEIADNIALIQRGSCDFDDKIRNAQNAGAVAAVVYSNDSDVVVMAGSSSSINIPAVMITQSDGNLILNELFAGEEVEITLDKTIFVEFSTEGDQLSTFSGRGPDIDFLKPDVVAPGEDILGGHTPVVANSFRGEQFQYLSGTSQSTPHVAGLAALIKEAHPDWTPAEIKSALMTSATQAIVLDDGVTAANAFEIGAGRVVPNDAVDPGLVFDAAIEEYDAYLCENGFARNNEANCEELRNLGFTGNAEDINLPSLLLPEFVAQKTITRRVTNPSETAVQFNAVLDEPDGISVEVQPTALTLGPGEIAEYTVTFSSDGSALEEWLFGSIIWTDGTRDVYTPFAVSATFFSVTESVAGTGASGSAQINVQFGYDGPYNVQLAGLYLPCVLPDNELNDAICTNTSPDTVANDPGNSYFFDVPAITGVTRYAINLAIADDAGPPTLPVAVDDWFLRILLTDELTDGNDDLDLYLWYCDDLNRDGNCEDTELTLAGLSANEDTSNELIDIAFPAGGQYILDVHGYETDDVTGGEGARYRLYTWSFGSNNNSGNLNVTGNRPGATLGQSDDFSVNWQNLNQNGLWFGGLAHSEDPTLPLAITTVEVDNDNTFPVFDP